MEVAPSRIVLYKEQVDGPSSTARRTCTSN